MPASSAVSVGHDLAREGRYPLRSVLDMEEQFGCTGAASGPPRTAWREGLLVQQWRPSMTPAERKTLGLYRADGTEQLDSLRGELPLHEWMSVTITPLEPHPSDPS